LAALVTPHADGIEVTHAPVVVQDEGGQIAFEMHVARGNPHWKRADGGLRSVAIFQGPHAYVSPSFYPSKREHGKVVPTWAYIVVHAHGVLETMRDPERLMRHLEQLTHANEKLRSVPWQVSDAPEPYLESMMRGIVGMRFTVERLEGAWKFNQHKSEPDWKGTAEGLEQSGEAGVELARALRSWKAPA
jgi:transcriptional regulator